MVLASQLPGNDLPGDDTDGTVATAFGWFPSDGARDPDNRAVHFSNLK
jgi:hypothetical protein